MKIIFLALYVVNAVVNGRQCKEVMLDKRGEDIRASRGNEVGVVDIADTMIIEMDVAIGILDSKAEVWESVFHIGNENVQTQPGIWFHSSAGTEGDLDGFTLSYGRAGNTNDYIAPTQAGGAFTDNMFIRYKSIQTQDHLTIIQNDETIFDAAWGAHTLVTGVKVYVGDPWYDPADVVISNLVISKGRECDCSKVDIDGYLSQCSDVFEATEVDVSDLRADVDDNAVGIGENAAAIAVNVADIGGLRDDVNDNTDGIAVAAADIEVIKADLALIADIYATQRSAPLFDFNINTQNMILLLSLVVNMVLAVVAYCMYTSLKRKRYTKVRAYADSEN